MGQARSSSEALTHESLNYTESCLFCFGKIQTLLNIYSQVWELTTKKTPENMGIWVFSGRLFLIFCFVYLGALLSATLDLFLIIFKYTVIHSILYYVLYFIWGGGGIQWIKTQK